jgi:hypothetical protein
MLRAMFDRCVVKVRVVAGVASERTLESPQRNFRGEYI